MASATLVDKEALEMRRLTPLVLRDRGVFTILVKMKNLRTPVAESVCSKDFYHRQWEGRVVEEIVHLLDGKTSYRIVMSASLLRRAIKSASTNSYNIFHLSCHGSKRGVRLSDKTRISWEELAD